jgi:hypothetical protein
MSLFEQFLALKNQEEQVKMKRYDVEAEIYKLYQDELKAVGSSSFQTVGFKVTITKNLAHKIDQECAPALQELLRTKYEFDQKKYDAATDDQKKAIDAILTITPNKPTFKVERL